MQRLFVALKVLLGVLVLGGFLYVSATSVDPDHWWHLTVGERILEQREVPRADIYTHSMPGHEWVDHEWLIDAWLAWMDNRGLSSVVVFLFSLIAAAPFVVWIRRAKSFEFLFAVFLGAMFLLPFMGVRPQVISFALFFLLFELLRTRYGGNDPSFRTPQLLIGIPLFFFVWANLHGAFFSGLVILGLFPFLYHVERWWKRREIEYENLRYDIGLFTAAFAIVLVNPYGIGLYEEVFRVMFSPETARYVVEWQPGLNYPYPGFMALTAVFFFLVIQFFWRYPLSVVAPAAFFSLLYLKSARHGPLFVLAALPFFETGLRYAREQIFEAYHKKPFTTGTLLVLKGLAIALFAIAISYFSYYTLMGRGELPYPERAVEALKEEAKKEPLVLMNDYGWGGYLIFYAPETKVFVDGRMPHWKNDEEKSAMKDYVRVFYTDERDAVKEVFRAYGINAVLMKQASAGARAAPGVLEQYFSAWGESGLNKNPVVRWIANFLFPKANDVRVILEQEGWDVAYEDEVAVLMRCYPDSCF